MGSGPKFSIAIMKAFGLALYWDTFPHQLSLNVPVGCVIVYIGFGKGYDVQ